MVLILKKILCFCIAAALLLLPVRAAAPGSAAQAMILLHGPSGRVLASHTADKVLPMASTTKILTCILALELADLTILSDIYAARETDTLGVSSAQLAELIPGALYCPTLENVTNTLRELAQPGDLILTVGAGSIYLAGEALVK